MHYEFSEQEQKTIATVGRTAGDAISKMAEADLSNPQQARDLMKTLASELSATAYMTAGLDEDKPLTPCTMAAMEAFAAAVPQLFIPFEMSTRVFGRLVSRYGTKEQQHDILTPLRSGSLTGAVALCETSLNVVNDPLTTRGSREKGLVTVSGEKGFVVGADTTDLLAVVGVLDDGLGVFLLDRQSPGVSIDKVEVAKEYASLHISAIKLDDCAVTANWVMGPVNDRQLLNDLRFWENQVLIAAANGLMSAALFAATAFAKEHRSGNKPVIAYQAVGFKLAEMLTLTQIAQLMAYKAAWLAETGDREAVTFTDCAKVFCADSVEEVAGGALRILSATGMAPDNPADIACRYAKYIQIAGTSTEIARVKIGDAVLKSS